MIFCAIYKVYVVAGALNLNFSLSVFVFLRAIALMVLDFIDSQIHHAGPNRARNLGYIIEPGTDNLNGI